MKHDILNFTCETGKRLQFSLSHKIYFKLINKNIQSQYLNKKPSKISYLYTYIIYVCTPKYTKYSNTFLKFIFIKFSCPKMSIIYRNVTQIFKTVLK